MVARFSLWVCVRACKCVLVCGGERNEKKEIESEMKRKSLHDSHAQYIFSSICGPTKNCV